jgi:hypothetical protein
MDAKQKNRGIENQTTNLTNHKETIIKNHNKENQAMKIPVTDYILQLEGKSKPELLALYLEAFGSKAPPYARLMLIRQLVYAYQESAREALETTYEKKLKMLTKDFREKKKLLPAPRRKKLPVGTVLRKKHRGKEQQVLTTDKGYVHDDHFYHSLSEVGEKITGSRSVSGNALFGI